MSLYGKRWGIECGLRDTKDPRFGMGMGSIHVSTPERRDRLWLLNAFAIALLTLLGAAGEVLPEVRLQPLIERFAEMLAEIPAFADTFGAI